MRAMVWDDDDGPMPGDEEKSTYYPIIQQSPREGGGVQWTMLGWASHPVMVTATTTASVWR